MNQILAFLTIAGTSLCYCYHHGWHGMFGRHWGGYHHFPRHHHYFMMNPPPPYLQDVSERAADEFYETVSDMGLTFNQQKDAIQKWAKRHEILDKVQKFDSKIQDLKTKMKAKVAKLATDLPTALEKFWSIVENRTYTPVDQRYALEKLSFEDPPLYHVMRFAIEQFLPLYDPYEGQRGPGAFYRYSDDDFYRGRRYNSRYDDRLGRRYEGIT
ncbi:hypothetical protein OESDEN_17640 [Oesophagostomum dentatum]|uniref:SXP/RAL-2 family protein Ani s 5-like cation-binding domain-containing protein n=1 Tax=Oesophagostomum dentatum TaxID=61180 RepID=A0A0B1SFM7_OESDE|nr:hypothetical protein OESDEN_17640 [Oesophagostomum dentatum]